MTDRQMVTGFILVGVVISVVNPVLGALVMFPAFVILVARRLTK